MAGLAGLARPFTTVAALAAVVGMASSVLPQTPRASISLELAQKKAAMLEMFLASRRLSTVLLAKPETAQPLVESARVHLDTGWDMLTADDPISAAAHFDKGISAISAAIALSSQRPANSIEAQSQANANRHRETRSYLGVLDKAVGLSAEDTQRVAELRARLNDAERMIAAGSQDEAWNVINGLYPKVVSLVSRVQRGRTAFVSKTFDTPEEALEHERARNDNYRLLVQLALAERGAFQPGLSTLAANLSTRSNRLRAEAEDLAAAGRAAEAVETMQRATERLLAVLRAAGLIVTGYGGGQ